jgi:Intracellular proteinase inhibitor
MMFRFFLLVSTACLAGCATKTPGEPARKPGFLERAWSGAQTGTQKVWESTKTGVAEGWDSTKDLAKAPFKKRSGKASKTTTLQTGIHVSPEAVKLPGTRSVEVKITVTNRAKASAILEFPTSQHVEVVVKNEAGAVIERWSDDQRVSREPGFVTVNPNERLEYVAVVSTRRMAAGRTYTIEASVPGYPAATAKKIVVPQS